MMRPMLHWVTKRVGCWTVPFCTGLTLVVGEVGKHLTIDSQHRALADEADEDAVSIDDGERPGMCAVEGADHHIHRIIHGEQGLGLLHQLRDGEVPVQLCAEDQVADVVEIDGTDELHLFVHHGEDVVLAVGDLRCDVAKVHVGIEHLVIMLYDAVHAHQRQDRLVGVVGEEFASLCKPHRVDAVRFEGFDGEVRACRHYHQGHEEGIAAGQLRDEEDAGQGCVHHAAHQSAHAQHGKVPFGNVDAQHVVHVPKPAKDKAADAAQKQTGREDTAATAAAVGGCRSKDLEDDDEEKIDEQVVAAIEEGAVHRGIPVGLSVTVEQEGDEVVAFAVERREEIDEQAQHRGSQEELLVATLQAAEDAFEVVHGAREVERNESADDAEGDVGWNAVHREGVLQVELKDGVGARDGKGESDGCDAADEQRQQAGHRQVYHQHFEHEDEPGNRCLEDTRHSSCCSAPHEQHHVLVAQPTSLTEAAADSTSGQHNGSLCTHTTAKADGNGRSHNGGPGVVRFDAALLAGNGKENLGDAVADVVADDISDEEHRQPNAHDGIDKVEPVGACDGELVRQQVLYLSDEPLQQKSCASREDANEETDEQHEVLVGQVPAPPTKQVSYEIPCIYHLIILSFTICYPLLGEELGVRG